jgi:hypothetical protein
VCAQQVNDEHRCCHADGGEEPPHSPAVHVACSADTRLGWDNIGLNADFGGELADVETQG